MYNRYLKQVQDVNDYIELDRPTQSESEQDDARRPRAARPPQMPSFYGRPENCGDDHAARPKGTETPKKSSLFPSLFGEDEGESVLGKLFGNFHMPKLEFDDILLLAIIFLMLREDGDDDLILIAAALYFAGL